MTWTSGRPMNILVFGDASTLTYRLTCFLLHQEHRVTLVEPIEFLQNVNYGKYKRFVQFQDDLRNCSCNDKISFLTASTCDIGQPSDTPFNHIIIIAVDSTGQSPVLLSKITDCLTALMVGCTTLASRPHLSLILDDQNKEISDCSTDRNALHKCVVRIIVESTLQFYSDLYNIPVTRLLITDAVNYQPNLLKHSVCETVCLETESNSDIEHKSRVDVVFSSYFTLKKDPQRGNYKKTNSYSYISAWHKSLTWLGLRGVVFHDGLDSNFTDSIRPKMYFEKVVLGNRSLNDDRYFHYLHYIETHPHLTYILMIDISDVTFSRDPLN